MCQFDPPARLTGTQWSNFNGDARAWAGGQDWERLGVAALFLLHHYYVFLFYALCFMCYMV